MADFKCDTAYDIEEYQETIKGWDEKNSKYLERYFTKHYFVNEATDKEDQYIMQAPNKLCIVGLAANHPLLASEASHIKSIEFSEAVLNNKVQGKRKKGALWLDPRTAICKITLDNEETFTIRAGVHSQLMEVNEGIVKTPELLLNESQSKGYIAILKPKSDNSAIALKECKSEEEYKKLRNLA
ncbi:hypothetical protein K493DRAFT_332476 [Basidiobolus meristosporus CBS 931.73]|uniref:Actin-binding transcription modulator n=1 Tax=Basidiobolus meristosporus CBS 931.73 TaxID=1314790 RepID=A0A1Y1ZCY4_9FUNG|nr:hypothetical protein K493DRAFT_332476 [Basidiobolus meristosporus CBS 931.73]|eukprot:ORY08143.1 hypothetical protein K493DRAFT_332476 [Basidiobolus meristosporus CBS 931.73]